MNKRKRKITLELDEDLYKILVEKSEYEGFSLLTDYIVHILNKHIRGEPTIRYEELINKLKPRIKRIVEDQMGSYMEIISNIRKQLTDLYGKIDELRNEVEELKKKETVKPVKQYTGRKTGIERLREEKIVYESQLPPRLQRDRFFNYLEREGAVVIYLSKERIAVDPDYWREFRDKLFNIVDSDDEEEIKKILGKKGFELFQKLREESIIYYDPRKRKWFPADNEVFK